MGGTDIVTSLRCSDVGEVGRVGPLSELLCDLGDRYRDSLVDLHVGEQVSSWARVQRVRLVAGGRVRRSSRDGSAGTR